jgi:alginate O-acetyltransferase complex protein AlgI
MVQSAIFWLVLTLAVTVNWLLPKEQRPKWIVAVSVAYIASLDLVGVAPLLAWVALIWVLRARIATGDKLGHWLVVGLIGSVIVQLGYFKYLPPLLSLFSDGPARQVVIPIGISFITFRLIHYILETRRGTLPAHDMWDYLSWATLFTIWTAGPIERIDHFLAAREDKPSREMLAQGGTRIILGLGKKFVIGLQLVPLLFGQISDGKGLVAHLHDISTLEAWRFLILSFFLFYLDFSAYSDIAIGSSRLMGFKIGENFNWPILATNPAAYWKRWHMSLSNWCQAYVYLPVIGLTRNPYWAVFASFTAIGLWHAGNWNWLAWGLYHAAVVTAFQAWARYRKKKKWTFWEKSWLAWPGMALTVCYTSVAQSFSLIQGVGGPLDALRILAKLVFIEV